MQPLMANLPESPATSSFNTLSRSRPLLFCYLLFCIALLVPTWIGSRPKAEVAEHKEPADMPPKKKPPSQAGKFKPLKRKKEPRPAGVASSAVSATGSTAGRAGRHGEYGRGRGAHSPAGRGRGHIPDGRMRSGRGGGRRGGGRGGRGRGRFIVPTGAAFFTGEAAKRAEEGGGGAQGRGGLAGGNIKRPLAGTDGAVFMPGSSRGDASSSAAAIRSTTGTSAAAARAREGEGEEIIVAEMLDMEEGGEGGERKRSVLDGPSSGARIDGLPSLFDDENQAQESIMSGHIGIADGFLYDSDSSAEEQRARRKFGGNAASSGFRMPPTQLPFPVASHQQAMYECQEKSLKSEEEKKMDAEMDVVGTATNSSSKLSDPPLRSPFLEDVDSAPDELRRTEAGSWFLMKFPTRLPHLDTFSSTAEAWSRAAALIKSELEGEEEEESLDAAASPDAIGQSAIAAGGSGGGTASSAAAEAGALGYDDTLKDAAAGRYGRIVIRRSGKTELVIGGGEGTTEVRLLVHEGLQCGFKQEAVSIDSEEATFVSLGAVNKSLIVTPDVESVFVYS